MFKLLNFGMILSFLIAPCAFAQSIFDQPAAPKSGSPAASMSSNDFLNAVNQRSQQTKSGLSEQAKQLYPKPQTGAKGSTTPGSQQPGGLQATPAPAENSYSVNSGAPSKIQPGAVQPGTAQPGTAPTDQPYTGFGGGTKSTSKPSTPASDNSGGWNINY
jgi:hypothetical protein